MAGSRSREPRGLRFRITSYNVCYTKLLRVGSEVEFREIDEARKPAAAYPGILEIEGHEAHVSATLPQIELQLRMQIGPHDLLGDSVGQEYQIGPPGLSYNFV